MKISICSLISKIEVTLGGAVGGVIYYLVYSREKRKK